MRVFIEKENRTIEITDESITSGLGLLNNLKITLSNVILVRNETIILPEDTLRKEDNIKILSVISGG